MSDAAVQSPPSPSPENSQWFHIRVQHPGGQPKGWPSGETYMSQAVNDAMAYKSYMIVASKGYGPISSFTWESGGPRGNYLRDQDGWYLGYDGSSKCLCQRSKGLSSFWEIQESNGVHYLRDITSDSRYMSWKPDQDWPLASTTLFISEEDGPQYALTVSVEPAAAPVLA